MFSPPFAACLFVWVVLGAVRSVSSRQWGKFAIAALGATAVFGYALGPYLLSPYRPPFFPIPRLWRSDLNGFELIRFVAGLLCIGAASRYYILPLFTKRVPDAPGFGYLFVLLALISLGFQGVWVSAQFNYDQLFPITPLLRFLLALFLSWLAIVTVGAFAVIVGRPSAPGGLLRAAGGGVISLYELVANRRGAARVATARPLTSNEVLTMSGKNPEDFGLMLPSPDASGRPAAGNFLGHSLQKRGIKRQREITEEEAKNIEAQAKALRAAADALKARNDAAIEARRSEHLQPRLDAEGSGYQATTAENQARKAEAEARRIAAVRGAEVSSQPRQSPADELTKRMEKITRRFEQLSKQGTDKEALAAWVKSSWGAEIDLLRARGDEVGAQRLEQQLQQILDDIATGEV